MKHAILGWGSLLWDEGEYPLALGSEWTAAGLTLPLEFSRVSNSRKGALTLVLDPENGADCAVSFAVSSRRDLEDVICDLRSREGTVSRRIGFIDRVSGGQRANVHPASADRIHLWAEEHNLSSVVWTDLPSNFNDNGRGRFNLKAAEQYLQSQLDDEGARKAKEYIDRAPKEVQTPLRKYLESAEWWAMYGAT